MAREEKKILNSAPAQSYSLSWKPASISITNTSRFNIYVNIGTVSTPSSKNFSDMIAPFAAFSADPQGASDFAIAVDNSSDPNTAFFSPVNVVFSSGLPSSQAALGISQTGIVNSPYLAKVLTVQPAFLIDLWALDDLNVLAYDRVNTNRNGVYINSPTLASIIGPDAQIKTPSFNGTNQYVDVLTPSLQSTFDITKGSMLIWVQMTVALWGNVNPYEFFRVAVGADNTGYNIQKDAANRVAFHGPDGNNLAIGITASNNWFAFVWTWSQANTRRTAYINGSQVAQMPAYTAMGAMGVARLGATNIPDRFTPGSMAVAAIWTIELTASEVLKISTAP